MKVGVTLMPEQRFDFKCVLRSRLSRITELHGQALAEVVNLREPTSGEAQLPIKDLILRFAGSDPTPGKSRTQWLIKTYIWDEKFNLEDLGRAHAALAAFERFKRKLPVEQRELSRFKSLRTLEELVDPFVKAEAKARLERDLSTATGREKRRLEELKARDESIIVQEGEGIPTIAVPMTEFASCWWGRGTKWCTAAEKNNAFQEYHKKAPLIIMVCNDGAKFQANVTPKFLHFMDATDTNATETTIRERWNDFQPLISWIMSQNWRILLYLHKDMRTQELWNAAVEQDGMALYYVPEKHKTPELCRLAIEQNGEALEYIPEEDWTPKLCRMAVEQNGWTLEFVPVNQRTTELYRLAVQQCGALDYVPEHKRTPELCRIAVEQNGHALQHVPENLMTPELYRLAVEQDGRALEHVPEEDRTPELCRIAVEQNGLALGDVPEEHKTSELCRIAIEQDGRALSYVPKKHRSPELCYIAVEQNGCALSAVPEKHQTPELYYLAVEQNGRELARVPESHRTPELCRLAIEQDEEALESVPEEHRTPELLALILPIQPKWHPNILQGLSQHFKLHESVTQQQDNKELCNHGSISV
jgi:Domain of unknown function (DUF4116)